MPDNNFDNHSNDVQDAIDQARSLRRNDKLEESQEILLSLLGSHPTDPLVLFEVGGSYDVLGEESEAIPHYRQAISEGLEGEDLQECLVCLGSSLRVVGRAEEAVDALEHAVASFPDNQSGRVFLALAYLDDDRIDDSVGTLLDVILATAQDEDIRAYSGALEYYRDELLDTLEDE